MRDGRLLAATTAPELLERTGAATLDEAFLAVIRRGGDAGRGGAGREDDDGARGEDGQSGARGGGARGTAGRDGALQDAEAAR